MTIHEQKEEGYITLKEASERFGYTPDYIGQLIRKGKIEGKQVYANVAWMTTAEAIEEYLARLSVPQTPASEKHPEKIQFSFERFLEKMFSSQMMRVYTWFLRVVLITLFVVLVFVFYFLSVAIDHKMARVAELQLETGAPVNVISYEHASPLADL